MRTYSFPDVLAMTDRHARERCRQRNMARVRQLFRLHTNIKNPSDAEVRAAIFGAPVHFADVTQTAASVLIAGGTPKPTVYTAGAALTCGDLVYIDSNGLAQKTYNNSTINFAAAAGYCVAAALAANQWTAVSLNGTLINIGGTLVKGTIYCVSANAGKTCPVADVTAASGSFQTQVGYAISTSQLQMAIVAQPVAVA
jgi:hypothetical protein